MSATQNKTMTARATTVSRPARALGFGFLTEVRASPVAGFGLLAGGGQCPLLGVKRTKVDFGRRWFVR